MLRRLHIACVRAGIPIGSPLPGGDAFCPGQSGAEAMRLLETRDFYIIADAFPITPGHILIISKRHYPCIGAMPRRCQKQLQQLIPHLSRFLAEEYGAETMLWENGRYGQSVPHAHLQVIPVPRDATLPAPQAARAAESLDSVHRAYNRGPYLYVELKGDRRLVRPQDADWKELIRYKFTLLGVEPLGRDRRRDQHASSVTELRRRWAAWQARQLGDSGLAA